jgi:hypothetical protein
VGKRFFLTRPDHPQTPPRLLYDGHQVSFPGGKAAGAFLQRAPLSEAKGRVDLYLYSPPWAFMACYIQTVPFTFVFGYNLVLFVNEDSGKVPWRDIFGTEITEMLM